MTVLDHGTESISLPPSHTLTVVSTIGGSGQLVPKTPGYGAGGFTALAAGSTTTVGPYPVPTQFDVVVNEARLTTTIAEVDFPTAAEALAAAEAADFTIIGTIGDLCEIIGAGVPVDYTDGTPPATGEGVAGPGSRYTDITNAKLYLNGGTKAQPLWKNVTSA